MQIGMKVIVLINNKPRKCVVKQLLDFECALVLVENVFLWETKVSNCIPVLEEKDLCLDCS